MSKSRIKDETLGGIAECIKDRIRTQHGPGRVRITSVSSQNGIPQSIQVRFPLPKKSGPPRPNPFPAIPLLPINADDYTTGVRLEIIAPQGTNPDYRYHIVIDTPYRIIETANPASTTLLDQICDALVFIASGNPKPKESPRLIRLNE